MTCVPKTGHRYINLSQLTQQDRQQLASAMKQTQIGQARLKKMRDVREILAPVIALGASLRMPEPEYQQFLTKD